MTSMETYENSNYIWLRQLVPYRSRVDSYYKLAVNGPDSFDPPTW
jgi:hypothetical protein